MSGTNYNTSEMNKDGIKLGLVGGALMDQQRLMNPSELLIMGSNMMQFGPEESKVIQ